MNKPQATTDILAKALPLVPFEGWTSAMLAQAAVAASYKDTDTIRVFPGGAIDAIEAFIRETDRAMLEGFSQYHLETMKIRERIAAAVRLRLEILSPHREAVRKAMAILALPFNAHRALKGLYATTDAIWRAAGDTSTDFNFYTKRLMLAGVYSSTLLHWLDDQSPGHENTWAFLDRRIGNVMAIEKAKQKIKGWLGKAA